MTAMVRCERLVQVYGTTGQEVTALRSIDLDVDEGETVALLGPSGAGKSTLLWLLAGLIRPTAGIVEVGGKRINSFSPREATELRRSLAGIVLQTPSRNLIPYETAAGNVQFSLAAGRVRGKARGQRVTQLLESVGLADLADRRAGRLSGGEQQRLALAVALANRPRLLLADEPTSQLDHVSAGVVLDLIRHANQEYGTTVVSVTHDEAVGTALGRTVTIRDGRVGAEGRHGDEYLVVGRDGTIQLPADLLETFPPGSLARAHRTPAGVELRPAAPTDEPQP